MTQTDEDMRRELEKLKAEKKLDNNALETILKSLEKDLAAMKKDAEQKPLQEKTE